MTTDHNIGENVMIRENDNGEAEIIHKSSGESAVLNGDGLHTGAHSTGQLLNKIGDSAIQTAWDGLVVPVAQGLGADAAVDPSATSTPVADAYTKVANAGGGKILLPPETIQEDSSLTHDQDGVSLIGWGIDASTIEFTDTTSPAVVFDGARRWYWDGVTFDGVDQTATGRSAWRWISTPRACNVGTVGFGNWGDGVINFASGAPFNSVWQNIVASPQTGGFSGPIIDASGSVSGPGFTIEVLSVSPDDGGPVLSLGQPSNGGAHSLTLGELNIGGTPSTSDPVVFTKINKNGQVQIGNINVEPTSSQSWGTTPIMQMNGAGPKRFGNIHLSGNVSADHWAELGPDFAQDARVPVARGSYTVNTNEILISGNKGTPQSYYYGPSGDVTDNSGDTTGRFRCLASAGTGL